MANEVRFAGANHKMKSRAESVFSLGTASLRPGNGSMPRTIGRAAQVLSPRGGIRDRIAVPHAGIYLAGFLCLILAVLKLTMEGHWSWWRVLLPLWVLLGHNALYIAVGFVWLTFADNNAAREEATIHPSDGSVPYQVAALLSFLLFADNLLARIEGIEEITWFGLRSAGWVVIVASGILSVMCQLLFWSTVLPAGNRRTWEE